MRKADIACGFVLLFFGGLVLRESLELKIGWGLNGPEAGFFPFWLATGLVICSTVIMVQAFLDHSPSGRRPFVKRGAWLPVIKVALPAFGMVALTEAIGLYPAAFIYLAAYMRWIGKHRWITTVLVSILLPVVSYFIFDRWFLIPMPKGYWTWISGLY
ncbi:MAG: tripartite tricarboxylate transporter TctB family protein [Deltaproteobacteria bacterium]|nr:tripartite tricarboxylate transporter TctB family protein [Deltaproteobacteria bacterium]